MISNIYEVRGSFVVPYAERYAKALASRRPLGRRSLSDTLDIKAQLSQEIESRTPQIEQIVLSKTRI
ncbi:MAG: hypothetical protein ACRC8K_22325 [Waterburya sp.]